jgi:hypothetical protein
MRNVSTPGLVRHIPSFLAGSAVAAAWVLSPQSALLARGFPVVALANPPRSVEGDAAHVGGVVSCIRDGAPSTPAALPDGCKAPCIQPAGFPVQLAADVSGPGPRTRSAGQRPITDAALSEGSGPAAWKAIPSWLLHGDADGSIAPEAMRLIADRAGSRRTGELRRASRAVRTSRPIDGVRMIAEPAGAGSIVATR